MAGGRKILLAIASGCSMPNTAFYLIYSALEWATTALLTDRGTMADLTTDLTEIITEVAVSEVQHIQTLQKERKVSGPRSQTLLKKK